MTATPLPEKEWDGLYRIEPRRGAYLVEHDDGALGLCAEHEYLVEMPEDAREEARQALEMLRPGLWLLRFGNFVGESTLGGRCLRVESNRLRSHEVEAMLDDVIAALQSLPFSFATPVGLAYARDVLDAPDVPYQAYAFLRHALRGIGPHDLPAAFDRILAQPHTRLVPVASAVALARADRADAETIMGLARGTGPFYGVPSNSPLADSPVAVALGGRVPETVPSHRMVETTNTAENRLIVAVLEIASGIVHRFSAAVRQAYPDRAERHLEEAAELGWLLHRWRRHRALADIPAARRLSVESTVLRGRPGYRQVTGFFADLQARTRLLDTDDARRLLEARDAALIYEYWCYFQVVDAVSAVLSSPPSPTIFRHESFGSRVPWGHAADFGAVKVYFNRRFSPPDSYSVSLRPDITLELADGTLHLFDAKLKREPLVPQATSDDELEQEEQRSTYRRGDLYKMHAYRDALGASSVWILFPGRGLDEAIRYEAHPREHVMPMPRSEPSGVGALPLRPGAPIGRLELETLLESMLSGGWRRDSQTR